MLKQASLFPNNYDEFFRQRKERIRSAQVKAALSVNQEIITLLACWRDSSAPAGGGLGSESDRLARDLKIELPETTGISPQNLNYVRSFAEAYPDEAILHQLSAKTSWRHNCITLDKVKDYEQRI